MTEEEVREHMDMLIAHKDKALKTHPYFNRCDSCTHSEEQDGSNCYECVKGMTDNFEAQPTEMRDATEEERKSVKDYVESISKPTGFNFYKAQPTSDDDGEGYKAVYVKDIKAMPPVTPQASEEDIHREREQAYMLGYEDASKKFRTEPNEDCISRESLRQKLQENYDFFVNAYGGFGNLPQSDKPRVDEIDNCIAMVVNEPSVYPERLKGKWIHWTDDYKDYCTCSKCGYGEEGELLLKNITPFCPYCGSYNGGREDAD